MTVDGARPVIKKKNGKTSALVNVSNEPVFMRPRTSRPHYEYFDAVGRHFSAKDVRWDPEFANEIDRDILGLRLVEERAR